jgi:hypothetical protein
MKRESARMCRYMAPELLASRDNRPLAAKRASPALDAWALGVLAWELLTSAATGVFEPALAHENVRIAARPCQQHQFTAASCRLAHLTALLARLTTRPGSLAVPASPAREP